jgi:hypothetical protein
MDRFTRDGALSATANHLGLRGVIASQARPSRRSVTARPPAHVDDTPSPRELFGGHSTAVDGLQISLDAVMTELLNYVMAVEDSAPDIAARLGYYTVTFGPGAFGMVLVVAEDSSIRVSEMRFNSSNGEPLLAKASGKIRVGDAVVAINGIAITRAGPPTLAQVAATFQAIPRPVTVLFKRGEESSEAPNTSPDCSSDTIGQHASPALRRGAP